MDTKLGSNSLKISAWTMLTTATPIKAQQIYNRQTRYCTRPKTPASYQGEAKS